MYTFNRSAVFSAFCSAVQVNSNSAMVRAITGAQLALTGDFSEADRLAMVGLGSVPPSTDKIGYEKFKYSGKLVRTAQEVLKCKQDIKDRIMAVDALSDSSLLQFQGEMAIKGCFFNTATGFERFIIDSWTDEAKAEHAQLLSDKRAKKAPKTTAQTTPTATAKASDTVSHEAGQQAANNQFAVLLALQDQHGHAVILAALQAVAGKTDANIVAAELSAAWQADRSDLLAKLDLSDEKAEKAQANATKQAELVAKLKSAPVKGEAQKASQRNIDLANQNQALKRDLELLKSELASAQLAIAMAKAPATAAA